MHVSYLVLSGDLSRAGKPPEHRSASGELGTHRQINTRTYNRASRAVRAFTIRSQLSFLAEQRTNNVVVSNDFLFKKFKRQKILRKDSLIQGEMSHKKKFYQQQLEHVQKIEGPLSLASSLIRTFCLRNLQPVDYLSLAQAGKYLGFVCFFFFFFWFYLHCWDLNSSGGWKERRIKIRVKNFWVLWSCDGNILFE